MKNIFEYLLNEFEWPEEYLESALTIAKESNNLTIQKELESRLKILRKSKKCNCCICF